MSNIVEIELWVVLIFTVLWVIGNLGNWVLLGLLTKLTSEVRKIIEFQSKESS